MTSAMKTIFFNGVLLLSAIFLLPVSGFTAENTELPSVFDYLLGGEEVLKVELHTDLTKLLDGSLERQEGQDALLVLTDDQFNQESFDLKLEVRGKFRRRICDFPPLKWDFAKKQLEAKGLNKHDKLKLVTHCEDDRIQGQDQLLREYLAYELYQTLSPKSFRTRLVRIRYVDTEGEIGSFRRYGFIIEDPDELGERLQAEECENCLNPPIEELDRSTENFLAMFNYMIGNTDYSIHMNRNVKFYRSELTGQLILVGYDFDFSGLVNASYAIPNLDLEQKMIRERLFMGLAADNQLISSTIALFADNEEVLLNEVKSFKLLSRSSRDDISDFLELFFEELKSWDANANTSLYMQIRSDDASAIPTGGKQESYQLPLR